MVQRMTVKENTKKWIKAPEAALRVGYSKQVFVRMIKDGTLPPGIAHRPVPKGHWLIDLEALDEWVRNGCFVQNEGDAA